MFENRDEIILKLIEKICTYYSLSLYFKITKTILFVLNIIHLLGTKWFVPVMVNDYTNDHCVFNTIISILLYTYTIAVVNV